MALGRVCQRIMSKLTSGISGATQIRAATEYQCDQRGQCLRGVLGGHLRWQTGCGIIRAVLEGFYEESEGEGLLGFRRIGDSQSQDGHGLCGQFERPFRTACVAALLSRSESR